MLSICSKPHCTKQIQSNSQFKSRQTFKSNIPFIRGSIKARDTRARPRVRIHAPLHCSRHLMQRGLAGLCHSVQHWHRLKRLFFCGVILNERKMACSNCIKNGFTYRCAVKRGIKNVEDKKKKLALADLSAWVFLYFYTLMQTSWNKYAYYVCGHNADCINFSALPPHKVNN